MKNKNIFFYVLSVVACGFLFSGCATPQSKALKEIRVGMDKADVLEIAGNPNRITRHLGQDRWTYEDFSNESSTPVSPSGKKTTFVYFSEGRVTYVGPAEVNPDNPSSQKQLSSDGKSQGSGFKPISE